MIRVLFIARYRDPTMSRKVDFLAREADLAVWHVCPRFWRDDLVQVKQPTMVSGSYRQSAIPMLGLPADPHRALYRTLAFGMARFRPHIVHAEEEPDSLAALHIALARRAFARRAKLVLHTWQNVARPRRSYVRLVLRVTLGASDAVLCSNSEAIAVLRQHGYEKDAILLPAVGVDTHTFMPRPRSSRPDDSFAVGYVGRLVPEKGLDTLISALVEIDRGRGSGGNGPHHSKDVKLIVIGDGPARHSLQAHLSAIGLRDRVLLVPALPPSQVAREMSQLDVLVLPSRTTPVWKEQFGRVLPEAMACKVPVVGSDSGAIPEVIGDAGLVFPEGNVHALVGCLRRLMDSPSLRHELAERGYARAMALYSQERIAEQTAEFYRRIMKCQAPRQHA